MKSSQRYNDKVKPEGTSARVSDPVVVDLNRSLTEIGFQYTYLYDRYRFIGIENFVSS